MMNRKASVAKWVALAVVPLSLAAVVAYIGQRNRAESAVRELSKASNRGEAEFPQLEKLIREGADVNARDGSGSTALRYAVGIGTPEVKILLDHGADVNARDIYGTTPLMVAVIMRDVDSVRLLLRHGANPNLNYRPINGEEESPLDEARSTKSTEVLDKRGDVSELSQIIQLLKAAGAKE